MIETIQDILTPMNYTFDTIGFIGPIILIIISIITLLNQRVYLISYLAFLFGNTAINGMLKHIIKQDRPTDGKSIMNEPYNGIHKYGMPSSHAQSAFFSMTYLYLIKDLPGIIIVVAFISALTMYQRWKYRQHTLEQLCVGAFIGVCVAYAGVFVTKQWLETRNF